MASAKGVVPPRLRQRLLLAGALLVALGLGVACGVVVVLLEARQSQVEALAAMESYALARANQVSESITSSLNAAGLVIPYINRNPGPGNGVLSETFHAIVHDWLDVVPGCIVTQMFVSHQAVGVAYALPPLPPNAIPPKAADMVFDPASGVLYNQFAYMLRTQQPCLNTPLILEPSTIAFALQMPIFVNASSPAETWGWPANASNAACLDGRARCWNATTGKKWWGYVAVAVGRKEFATTLGIKRLQESDYGYMVRLAEVTPGLDDPLATTPTVLVSSEPNCKSETVTATAPCGVNLELSVEICEVGSSVLQWEVPSLVVSVVVPILLVGLLGVTITNWLRHSELLHSLLPSEDIDKAVRSILAKTSPTSVQVVNTECPADKLITVLSTLVQQERPYPADVVQLLHVLKKRQDLYLPYQLESRIREMAGGNGEVAQALLAVVGPGGAASAAPSTATDQQEPANRVPAFDGDAFTPCVDLGDLRVALMNLVDIKPEPATPRFSKEEERGGSSTLMLSTQEWRSARRENMFDGVTATDVLTTSIDFSKASLTRILHSQEVELEPMPSLITHLEGVLSTCTTLNGFDAMELALAANGHALSALGFWVLMHSGVVQALQLPQRKIARFLRAIEKGYRNNPYHSATHAADVLQSVHALLHTGGMRAQHADTPVLLLSCYMAAIVHDYDHRGVTNAYLVSTKDDLAVLYNDKSPHENHHISSAMRMLGHDNNNFLCALPKADVAAVRKLAIELVLATDMGQHFALVGSFATMHRLATADGIDSVICKGHSSKSGGAMPPPTATLQVLASSREPPQRMPTWAPAPQIPASTGCSEVPGVLQSARRSRTELTPALTRAVSCSGTGEQISGAGLPSMLFSVVVPMLPGRSRLAMAHTSVGLGVGAASSPGPPDRLGTDARNSTPVTWPCNVLPQHLLAASQGPSSQPHTALAATFKLSHVHSSRDTADGKGSSGHAQPPSAPADEADRLLCLQMMLKCADLGHVATSLPIHLKWVVALEEEMFLQGDQEAALGLPISPLCKRGQASVTHSQVGFFTTFALPLFATFALHFPAAAPLLDATAANYRYWLQRQQAAAEQVASG